MKSPRRCVDAAHGCQGGESNRQPDPTDDKDSGAKALQEGKQEACSAHGAEVEAQSTIGKGSCFRVKLPLAKKQ